MSTSDKTKIILEQTLAKCVLVHFALIILFFCVSELYSAQLPTSLVHDLAHFHKKQFYHHSPILGIEVENQFNINYTVKSKFTDTFTLTVPHFSSSRHYTRM